MHTNSNEVPSQNQLAIGEVAHKFYIHAQTLEFYQCGTNPTFIFQLSMWDNPPLFQIQQVLWATTFLGAIEGINLKLSKSA